MQNAGDVTAGSNTGVVVLLIGPFDGDCSFRNDVSNDPDDVTNNPDDVSPDIDDSSNDRDDVELSEENVYDKIKIK